MNIVATPEPAISYQPSPRRELSEAYEFDLWAIIATLWKGKWLIALVSLSITLAGGFYAFGVAVPVYRAHAVVALESRQEQIVKLDAVVTDLSGDPVTINTEVEVLKSRKLAKRLVTTLDLTKDPEFNPALRHEAPYSVRRLRHAVSGFLQSLGGRERAASRTSVPEQMSSTIDSVLSAMTISSIRQSQVFLIGIETTNPEKSARIANKLAEIYILDQLEMKYDATKQATRWLTDRVAKLKAELERSEALVKSFEADAKLVSAEGLDALNRQLKDLRFRLSEAEATTDRSATQQEALETAFKSGDRLKMAALADDATLTRLLQKVTQGGTSSQAFDALFVQILARVRDDHDRAAIRVGSLTKRVKGLEDQISAQSADLVELQQLQREADASRLIYEYFLGRLKETAIQQDKQQADSRVLSEAVVPLRPSAPRKSMILLLSLSLGVIAGSTLVLGREMTRSGFQTPRDAEMATGYRVLSVLPRLPKAGPGFLRDIGNDQINTALGHAIRGLRTTLALSKQGSMPGVIMFTSSTRGEGKSASALLFAQSLAALSENVLLITSVPRLGSHAEGRARDDGEGLIRALSSGRSLKECTEFDSGLKIDILSCQANSLASTDLLASDAYREAIRAARTDYDFIVIDAPASSELPDARLPGRFADAILYVLQLDKTPRKSVLEGLASFELAGQRITGLVCTGYARKT